MYARRAEDRELTFAVSGMLWKRSLVMIDSETRSLWSHLLGRCMRGPLEGAELEMLPSRMTDWKQWRREHPRTTVLDLSRTSTNYDTDFLGDLSKFVIAMASGSRSRAWPFSELAKQPVVNEMFAEASIVVCFDSDSRAAFIYERRLSDDGRELSFQFADGQLEDEQTHSRWELASGKAVAGSLKGRMLKPALGVVSYRRAWRNFHPDTTFWTSGESQC